MAKPDATGPGLGKQSNDEGIYRLCADQSDCIKPFTVPMGQLSALAA